MSNLVAIVKATRQSAACLKRAQAWSRAALQAEQERDRADRAGVTASADAAHSRMMQALRLRDHNISRHVAAQRILAANPLPGDR